MKKKSTLVLTAASLFLMSPMALAETDLNKATSITSDQGNEWTIIPYTDTKDHFAQAAISELIKNSVVDNLGYKGNQFAPNDRIKTADFQRWLERLTGVKVTNSTSDKVGINRLEAAVWIAEATGLADSDGNKAAGKYRDAANLKGEHQAVLRHLANLKVMVGDGNGHFRPSQGLTRGEAAVLLDRVAKHVLSDRQSIPYTELTESQLPETAYTMVQENKTAAGLFSVSEGGERFVMAAMGQRMTTGYAISIVDVYETERGVFVKVLEKRPEPGEPVGEAITYPYAVAKFKDTTKPLYLMKEKSGDKLGQIEHNGQIIKSQQADLDGDGTSETVALIGTEKDPDATDLFAKGYLGIFNHAGKRVQSFDLSGETLRFPVQLTVADLTSDGKSDILLESDLRANGGFGAHQLNVFTQQNGKFAPAPVKFPTDWNAYLALDYDKTNKAWLLDSKVDDRSWRVDLLGEQWKDYDPTTFMTKPYSPSVDPLYAVDLTQSVLKTRHYLYAGPHVNGIVGVVNTFKYQNNSFVLDKFDLESINTGTKVSKK